MNKLIKKTTTAFKMESLNRENQNIAIMNYNKYIHQSSKLLAASEVASSAYLSRDIEDRDLIEAIEIQTYKTNKAWHDFLVSYRVMVKYALDNRFSLPVWSKFTGGRDLIDDETRHDLMIGV